MFHLMTPTNLGQERKNLVGQLIITNDNGNFYQIDRESVNLGLTVSVNVSGRMNGSLDLYSNDLYLGSC